MLDEHDLPSFRRPPVVETVLSVEFRGLEGWSVPFYGLFWNRMREAYPKVEFRAPVSSAIERFDKDAWTAPQMQVVEYDFASGNPPVRCLFISDDGGQLIQLQRDRLMQNWQRVDGEYPRYPRNRAHFTETWRIFLDFLQSEQITSPDIVQCEVTYINHIEKGDGWATIADLPDVVPLIARHITSFLPAPEVIVLDERFLMPEEQGRLRVIAQPAIRNRDGTEVFQLTLTARGRPRSSDTAAILAWLDLGRRWVVKGFVDVTAPAAQERWGRTA